MADNLDFLRTNRPLGPLDAVPLRAPRPSRAPDPLRQLRGEMEARLAQVNRERNVLAERLRADHRHFLELEAGAAALVDALTDLERHRLAGGEPEGEADGA